MACRCAIIQLLMLATSRAIPMSHAASSTDEILLRGGPALLGFNASTGALTQIVDDAYTQRNFIIPSAVPLAVLVIRPTSGQQEDGREVHSSEFTSISTKRLANDLGVEFRFVGHATYGPRASLVASAVIEKQFVLFNISIAGFSTDWVVTRVTYPGFTMVPVLPGHPLESTCRNAGAGWMEDSDDGLVLPWYGGLVLPCPGRASQLRQDVIYPGQSPFQFSARYDNRSGIYFAHHDGEGHVKAWTLNATNKQSVTLTMTHLLPDVPQPDVTERPLLAYPVAISAFGRGGWREAARLYKTFAAGQTWCQTKLRERTDIPSYLTQGAGGFIVSLNSITGYNGHYGPNLSLLTNVTADFLQRSGLKHAIVVPYGWENRGTWAGINYFPAQPSDRDWVGLSRSLREGGISGSIALLISGFWWVVQRNATTNGPAFNDTAQLLDPANARMVVKNPNQTIWFDVGGKRQPWRGVSAELCHGSIDARAKMTEIFVKAASLGATLLSFDQ